jgi:hypothetical protein
VQAFTAKVADYNSMLMSYGIRDYQVNTTGINIWRAAGLLIFKIIQFVLITLTIVPGIVLDVPLFLLTEYMSQKKAKGT